MKRVRRTEPFVVHESDRPDGKDVQDAQRLASRVLDAVPGDEIEYEFPR